MMLHRVAMSGCSLNDRVDVGKNRRFEEVVVAVRQGIVIVELAMQRVKLINGI